MLEDTRLIADFMTACGQAVRNSPTPDLTDEERLLRVRLVMEEALEFAEAMGVTITPDADSADGTLTPKGFVSTVAPDRGVDIVEAADAISDLVVVVKGSAHTLGLPVDLLTRVVNETNMAKVGPDGSVLRHPETGKILKPEGWVPPTEYIKAILAHPVLTREPAARLTNET